MAKSIDIDRLELRASKSAQALKRSYAGPLDVYSYFNTLHDAQDYARTSPVAYVGQILTVVNEDEPDKKPEAYKIVDIAGTLEPLGQGEIPIATDTTTGVVKVDGTSITVTADGTISAVGGGPGVTVDDHLSTTSTNPVQNKVITEKINDLEDNEMKTRLEGTTLVFYKQS